MLTFSFFIILNLGWYPFLNSFMPLYKSVIFLFLILVSTSLILPFICSLFFFLNILLVSRLVFWRLSLMNWFAFCKNFSLACFR
jgi:hypothetical protein